MQPSTCGVFPEVTVSQRVPSLACLEDVERILLYIEIAFSALLLGSAFSVIVLSRGLGRTIIDPISSLFLRQAISVRAHRPSRRQARGLHDQRPTVII
jgi:hypothetical protein